MKLSSHKALMTVLILYGLLVPPVIFTMLFLQAPSISAENAQDIIANGKVKSILIDVRSAREFEIFHLEGAINIPLEEIQADDNLSWQNHLKNKEQIFLICNMGFLSAGATERFHKLGFPKAKNIEGGMDAWLAGGKRDPERAPVWIQTPYGPVPGVPRLEFSLFEQALISFAAFGIKPLYGLISLGLILLLFKNRKTDAVALKWAMIAFFLGENACAVNFLFYDEQSLLMEYLHMYGMMVSFGFASYAFMVMLDTRVIGFTAKNEKCILLANCRQCFKYQPVSCNLRLMFLYLVPATAIIAGIPLSGDLASYFYVGDVFGGDVLFGHFLYQQIIEYRICSLLSIVFLVIAGFYLLKFREKGLPVAKIYFAAALGPLFFGLMRFIMFEVYRGNPLWAEAWEEITEFIFIGFILWMVWWWRGPDMQFPFLSKKR
jgi:rhodanese-related sulfurtransferase